MLNLKKDHAKVGYSYQYNRDTRMNSMSSFLYPYRYCEQHSYCSIFLLLNQKLFFQIRLFSEHSVSEPLLFLMKIYNIYSLIEPQKTMLFLNTQEI